MIPYYNLFASGSNHPRRNLRRPHNNQSKSLLSYCNKLEDFFIKNDTDLLQKAITECLQKERWNFLFRFYSSYHPLLQPVPMTFATIQGFWKLLKLSDKRQDFFEAEWYKWIVYLIEDCIECQIIETKGHDIHEAALYQKGELEKTPIKTIHYNLKGPLRPSSTSNTHCFFVGDDFSRFLGAYPATQTLELERQSKP